MGQQQRAREDAGQIVISEIWSNSSPGETESILFGDHHAGKNIHFFTLDWSQMLKKPMVIMCLLLILVVLNIHIDLDNNIFYPLAMHDDIIL